MSQSPPSAPGSQITVRLPGTSYAVRIEEGIIAGASAGAGASARAGVEAGAAQGAAGAALAGVIHGRKAYLLADEKVWKLWGKQLLASLAPLDPPVIRVPSGERHKRMATVEKAAEQLSRLGADRSSVLLAFGGGVTGDLAGFVASIYLRGIDYVQIPTTFLAMVDSSVGGKTGANLVAGKNLIGTFHQPRMVLADPALLATLPARELRAGLFEAVKTAVIGDPALFEFLSAARKSVVECNPQALRHVIHACAAFKGRIVSQDEKEGGLRRVLNFGHTLGHAIEAATGYKRFLHGEAVAWGMLAATRLAVEEKLLAETEAERIEELIRRYGPVPSLRGVSLDAVEKHLGADKKVQDGKLHFVLPRRIGEVIVAGGIDSGKALRALRVAMALGPFDAPVRSRASTRPSSRTPAATHARKARRNV